MRQRSKRLSPPFKPIKPEYITRLDANVMMMQEFNRLRFLEEFQRMAPLIVGELVKAGVVFPKYEVTK